MKFPLPKNLFPPLELAERDEHDYEQLANTLVKATLGEYDDFVVHDQKRVDARRWKTVRTRDNVAIYRERQPDTTQTPSPAKLALYQSTISMSSRPSQGVVRPSSTHTVHGARGSSHVSPRKKSTFSWDPTDDTRDTYRNDSLLYEQPRLTTGAYSSTEDDKTTSGLPRLLAVGNLRGTLDDVMYGIVSPCASSVRLRSSYLGEHIADCAVLREIKGPSPSDPFRFLGIKWFVRAKHRATARLVLPRDFVILEFSGVMMRPDNSRVGFHLMHSITVPSCRELTDLHILRAKLSSCYIFEETRNNCVQLFMTASVDPRGHVLSQMAVRAAATALSNCWKSVTCAQNKKLAFYLQNDRPSTITSSRGSRALGESTLGMSRRALSTLTPVEESSSVRESIGLMAQRSTYSLSTHRRQCNVCRGKLAMLSKSITCQMCGELICSRCRIVRKLSSNTLNAQVAQSSINFCKKCVASVSHESALDIAREELWVRARGRTRASSALSTAYPKKSYATERSIYATVVLGRTSDSTSRPSSTTSGREASKSSPSAPRRPPEDSFLGYSVGPPSSASTQCSTLVPHPSSGRRSSKNAFSMSAGPLSSTSVAHEAALAFEDLGMERTKKGSEAAKSSRGEAEEPVVLDHRMTMRSLQHLDYVLSVGEQEIVDELHRDTEDYGDYDDYGDFLSEAGRSSHASSVAVMDDNHDMCETPTSDVQSRRKSLILEGTDESDASDVEDCREEAPDQLEEKSERWIAATSESRQQPPLSPTHEVVEETELDDAVPMAKSVYNHSDDTQEVAVAEEVEVVAAAPIRDALEMLDESHVSKSAPDEAPTRLNRAQTSAPRSEKAAYQHQLLQQMQDLHHVVESTYQVARANTEAALKERECDRVVHSVSPRSASENSRGVRTFSQPFTFNVVGLRSIRAMTVGISK